MAAEMWLLLCLFLAPPVSGSIVLTGLRGQFQSPGYPQGYPDDVSVTWEIRVPPGHGVELRFAHVDIEPSENCDYDHLQVLTEEALSPHMCGTSWKGQRYFPYPLVYRTSDRWATVSFITDFSNGQRYTGFSAFFTAVDIDECADGGPCSHYCNNYIGGYFCSCRPRYQLLDDGARCGVNCSGQVFSRFKGEFASPNYPGPYAENSQCHYRIQIEPGFEVILNFEGNFHVEGDPASGCRTDMLMIRSGRKEYGPFCGDQAPSIPEQLENTVDVTFDTDGTGERGGWRIKYHSTAKQCPVDVLEHGLISPKRDEYDYRDSIELRCERGYEILDRGRHPPSVTLVCQRDGSWNASSVACVPVDCGEPRRLRRGTAEFNDTLFQNRVKYSCEEPYYSLEGAEEFECSADATWVDVASGEGAMPKCTPVCGACHVLSGTGRIFGGSPAVRGQLPWQVRLRLGPYHGGGALLSDGWVLTAAHVVELRGALPRVVAGVTDLLDRGPERQELEAQAVFPHPDYQPQVLGRPDYSNDLALVKLKKRAKLGPTVSPLCLPAPEEAGPPPEGTLGLIAGWGRTEHKGPNSRSAALLWAQIPVVDMSLCRRADYGGQLPVFTESMLCAGQPGTDSCQGDSGGAYVFRGRDGRCVARGIVSFGPQKCGSFGVYTQLGAYAGWLREVMEANGQWPDDE